MDTQKDPILQRLEADLARAQNNREVYMKWVASGKTLPVQWRRDGGDWRNCESIDWKSYNEYRIRPEPHRIWVNEYRGGNVIAHESEVAANANAGPGCVRTVEFIEVIK